MSSTQTSTTTVPNEMRAWRKHTSLTEPTWESTPVPPCPRTGYLVRLIASGVCHSDFDLLKLKTHPPHFQDVYTLGHEGCGEIVEVGPDVADGLGGRDVEGFMPAGGMKVGDRVALLSVPGCGKVEECSECERDLPQLCLRAKMHGLGQDGFYAPFVAVDRRVVVPLPDGVSPAVAAVATDAVLTSYHGVTRRAEVKKHETVFLIGLGGLGFNALQIIINTIGARVIVSDIREERLEEAIKLGVSQEDVVPVGKTVQEFVKESGLMGKIDTVLDFVGKEQTLLDAQHIVRPGGKVLCVGLLDDRTTVLMKIAARKRLSFIFTYGGQYRDLVECLNLIAKGVITPQVETARLEDFPAVLKDLHEGKIKARMALLHEQSSWQKGRFDGDTRPSLL